LLPLHLKSRVGRRLFTRFLVAALLPISGLALYAYQNVERILVETAHGQLTRDGKAYAMSLIESIGRHAETLEQAMARTEGAVPAAVRGFAQLSLRDVVEPSARGTDRLFLQLRPGMAPEVATLLPGDHRLLVGQIDGELFWENEFSPEHFCVFNSAKEVMHCSSGLADIDGALIPESSREQNAEVDELRLNGTHYLLGFWRARYLPSMNSEGFIVMVATPKALALEDLAHFRVAFSAVALLAIALAAGLSISQIRQQLEPLVRLQESAGRLSVGDLAARAEIADDGEFGQLGQAFDQMAMHLQNKFHMLELLSQLDRAILGAAEGAAVVEIMLRNVRLTVACERAGLIAFDQAGNGELIVAESFEAEAASSPRERITAAELAWDTVACEDWCSLPPHSLPPRCMQALGGHAITQVLAFPARLEGRLHCLLLLAFAEPPERPDEIIQAGRSLADRLAISASTLAREQMLYQQAHYDPLTRLPNRLLLRDRTEQALAHADQAQTTVALLFVDLDGFKQVNDSLGHAMGDTLLVECADRLRKRMPGAATVARLGGDEFVVLLPDLARETAYATADRLAQDLNQILASPFRVNEQRIVSHASIGIALYPDDASGHEDLLKMADEAMYEAKRREAGGYCFYTSNISAQTRDRFELTQELRDAVEQQELLLYYQPKVDAVSGRLAGAEALLRWQSPKRGLVPPGTFVNLLDQMGLGTWLGEWVLDRACAQMHAWDEHGFRPFPVSINFSPLQFERTPIVSRVQSALAAYRLQPARLEVEILESMAANESPVVRQNLIKLRELGVSIALDDFGTGFSSLVHLTQVPADVVKLDRIFIHSLCLEPRQRELVELIISMAKVMRLKVVAEGVETEEQRQLLPNLGCDLLQGYLIGHPVAPDTFAARWLTKPVMS
jgi:diguanylate cyclase (GGDEF)-like protein